MQLTDFSPCRYRPQPTVCARASATRPKTLPACVSMSWPRQVDPSQGAARPLCTAMPRSGGLGRTGGKHKRKRPKVEEQEEDVPLVVSPYKNPYKNPERNMRRIRAEVKHLLLDLVEEVELLDNDEGFEVDKVFLRRREESNLLATIALAAMVRRAEIMDAIGRPYGPAAGFFDANVMMWHRAYWARRRMVAPRYLECPRCGELRCDCVITCKDCGGKLPIRLYDLYCPGPGMVATCRCMKNVFFGCGVDTEPTFLLNLL